MQEICSEETMGLRKINRIWCGSDSEVSNMERLSLSRFSSPLKRMVWWVVSVKVNRVKERRTNTRTKASPLDALKGRLESLNVEPRKLSAR